MKYVRESISLEEVLAALKSKQIETISSASESREGLIARGKLWKKRNWKNSKHRSKYWARNPDDKEKFKCYYYHKVGHYKAHYSEKEEER